MVHLFRLIGRAPVVGRLKLLLLIYLDCKFTLYLFLQGRYELLLANHKLLTTAKGRTSSPEAAEAAENALIQIRDHKMVMRNLGFIFGDLGLSSTFNLALHLSAHLIYYYGDRLLTNSYLSRIIQNDDFFLSHRDARLADERLNGVFNEYLNKMIAFNAHKLNALMGKFGAALLGRPEARQTVADLRRHQRHLKESLADKTGIWPPTARVEWRRKRVQFIVRCYALGGIVLHSASLFAVLMAMKFAHEISLERGEKPLIFLERLCIIEEFVTVFLTLDRVLPTIIMIFTHLRDVRLQLRTLDRRFDRLIRMLIELKRQLRRKRSRDEPEVGNKRQLAELRSKCDREALEIYISLRVFIDELRPVVSMSSFLLSECIFHLMATLGITTLFFSGADTTSMKLFTGVALILVSSVDTAFIAYAIFESSCKSTTQRAWSLVANSTAEANSTQLHHWEVEAIGRLNRSLEPTATGQIDCFTLNPLKGSTINQEIVDLWRRFVSDLTTVQGRFSCRLLDVIPLNFGEILSLNFLVMSMVLIFLTSRWQ